MNRELLSQLADGELAPNELETAVDALIADSALQRSWQSMHTLRAGMSVDSAPISLNIANKISAALEDETPIVAPNNIRIGSVNSSQAKTIVPATRNRNRGLAMMAIAASVAAVMMFGYSPLIERSTPTIATSNDGTTQSGIDIELQSMIVQHGEFSGAAALNGLAAYAKVVNGLNAQ